MSKDNKTIGITVRFFTDHLPEKVGKENNQIPFWTSGTVAIEDNKRKGIKAEQELFHYFDDIPRAIKTVMRKSKLAAVEDIGHSLRAKNRRSK
jgi:hypothetical protein